jgi:CubicO group peptidase (beta-lactamase class C family)
MTTVAVTTDLQARLDELAREHKVPGAVLAVLNGDDVIELATGVANANTKVETTPDTIFQIGSNTKVYTATLVMQLVDEGKVDLDAPVRRYVPDLALADEAAAEAITVRQLLTHTSGIEGDYLEDTGPDSDALERYVASMASLGQLHPPGERFSYCNAGFCIAGRLLELVTGTPYQQLLRERVLRPLGLHATTVLPEDMLVHRVAVGHIVMPGVEDPFVPPVVLMNRALVPAGSRTTATARDVLGFVRCHLDGGRSSGGHEVLSAAGVTAMQQPEADFPPRGVFDKMGLSWFLGTWDGTRVLGHGGGTIGQLSFMFVLPDSRFAVCLLTNATSGGLLWRELAPQVFGELAGVRMPEPPKPADPPPALDLTAYTGTYARLGAVCEITVEDGALVLTLTPTGALADAETGGPQRTVLAPVDERRFVGSLLGLESPMAFDAPDADGRPRYLYVGGRAARRAG